jgi:GH25 family lysozyme M1 (1,4-beta-N-acetylmuramidase)
MISSDPTRFVHRRSARATVAAATLVAATVPLGAGSAVAGATVSGVASWGTSHLASSYGLTHRQASTPTVRGIDVSHYQGWINWPAVRRSGVQFAYIKATEGIRFRDSRFSQNYLGAYRAGVIRGAYHYARPNRSGGVRQADHLVNNGGAWSRDNRTLPAMLDLEGGGRACYGLGRGSMVRWIAAFLNRYHARTGRWAMIYTTRSWWIHCTGDYTGFTARHRLMLARYSSRPGTPPGGWRAFTIWQHTSTGRVPGIAGDVDRDLFNGSKRWLIAIANNTR